MKGKTRASAPHTLHQYLGTRSLCVCQKQVSQVVEQECGPTQTLHNLCRSKWGHASETVEIQHPLTIRKTFSAMIVRRPNDGTATRDSRLPTR